ncbi:hypothetical protein [Roseomonas indoligenes]|uniref:Uncharacterized protein n=1 Tax=Roseomonas indoligenes TaxID=2820811 RepID=A0A940MUZ6_9PROT|nr:hypothetical protein [Pararoseomonas indoligenes]MBP0492203.1 hypothetical protein [Pararoseomonas indoligenes]
MAGLPERTTILTIERGVPGPKAQIVLDEFGAVMLRAVYPDGEMVEGIPHEYDAEPLHDAARALIQQMDASMGPTLRGAK